MTRRSIATLLAVLALLLAGSVLLAGCGSDDDPKSKAKSATKTDGGDEHADEDGHDDGSGDEGDDDEVGEATNVPEPVPAGELPPIQVTSPASLTYVNDQFVLAGSAQVFEGALQWAILDAKLKPMVQGRLTASCGAPCRGTFSKRISLTGVPLGSWELHVWAPPVADDDPDRVHDTMVPITVTAEPVEGAPDPGAIPPGGVPQGA